MAATPRWKVYSHNGEYLASFKYPEDAAVLIGSKGYGTTLRDGHTRIVWTEGPGFEAGESYDTVAQVAHAGGGAISTRR